MGKVKDITGVRYGYLVAVRKTDERKFGQVVWELKCDCGKTVYKVRTDLGGYSSCGCKKNFDKRRDLAGVRFGHLVAVRPTDKRKWGQVVWECKCDCGKTAYKVIGVLNDYSSCGCAKDLTGKRFGRLVVIKKTEKRYRTTFLWECRCDCGNVVYRVTNKLEKNSSCGCLAIELFTKDCIEGTRIRNIDMRKRAINRNNHSGVTGVNWAKDKQAWCARIMFKRKEYHLGYFKQKDDAIRVRKMAEEMLFEPFLEWYEEMKNNGGLNIPG